ncbi:hypothetical protein ACFVTC_20850 [Streptomyces sp. NPDC057950]|uniref:hypothetical protein n=1 Tax=Streptomyces sp. NPDC057950 TaxID=3346288 RepID=UPI0036EF4F27
MTELRKPRVPAVRVVSVRVSTRVPSIEVVMRLPSALMVMWCWALAFAVVMTGLRSTSPRLVNRPPGRTCGRSSTLPAVCAALICHM